MAIANKWATGVLVVLVVVLQLLLTVIVVQHGHGRHGESSSGSGAARGGVLRGNSRMLAVADGSNSLAARPPLPTIDTVVLHFPLHDGLAAGLPPKGTARFRTSLLRMCLRGLRRNARWATGVTYVVTSKEEEQELVTNFRFGKAYNFTTIKFVSIESLGLHPVGRSWDLHEPQREVLRQLPDLLSLDTKHTLVLYSSVVALHPTTPDAFFSFQPSSSPSKPGTWKPLTRRHETTESLSSLPTILHLPILASLSKVEKSQADVLPLHGMKCSAASACGLASAPVPDAVGIIVSSSPVDDMLMWTRQLVLEDSPPKWVSVSVSHSLPSVPPHAESILIEKVLTRNLPNTEMFESPPRQVHGRDGAHWPPPIAKQARGAPVTYPKGWVQPDAHKYRPKQPMQYPTSHSPQQAPPRPYLPQPQPHSPPQQQPPRPVTGGHAAGWPTPGVSNTIGAVPAAHHSPGKSIRPPSGLAQQTAPREEAQPPKAYQPPATSHHQRPPTQNLPPKAFSPPTPTAGSDRSRKPTAPQPPRAFSPPTPITESVKAQKAPDVGQQPAETQSHDKKAKKQQQSEKKQVVVEDGGAAPRRRRAPTRKTGP